MRLSLAVTTPEVEFTRIGILGRDFSSVAARIAAAGYQGIELMPVDPRQIRVDEVVDVVASLGLEVPAVGTGLVAGVSNVTLLHQDMTKRREAWDSFQRFVEFAAHFGALVTIGSIRGRLTMEDGRTAAGAWESAIEVLRRCAEFAGSMGLQVGIEPLNRYESNFINNVDEGLRALEELSVGNCGLVLDTFHMNIEEPRFETSLIKARGSLLHVHLGDSNRLPPGRGHIDFALVVRILKTNGYSGYLSGEMIPWPDSYSTIGEVAAMMNSVIAGTERGGSNG